MTIEAAPIDSRTSRFVEAVVAYEHARDNGGREEAERRVRNEYEQLTDGVEPFELGEIEDFVTKLFEGRVTDRQGTLETAALHIALRVPPPAAPAQPEPRSPVDRLRARILSSFAIEQLPPPSYLLDGIVVERSLGLLYGKPGGYKSVTALDWSASISCGAWWLGREVRKGPVLYVVAEGLAGMGQRVRAWKQQHQIHDLPDLYFLRGAVPLLSMPDVLTLCTVAAELAPVLVVIDTLSRSMAGGDENGAKDMSTVVDNMTRVQEATGAAVWLVHHATKADGTLRGHTALEGAMDTIVEAKGTDARLLLSVEKQKDDSRAHPVHLHVHEVELPGVDEPSTSIVLHDRPDPKRRDDDLTTKAHDVLRALELVALDDGVTTSVWLEAATGRSDSATGPSVSKSQFYEHKKTLLVRGLVRQIGEGRGARYAVATREEDPTDDF